MVGAEQGAPTDSMAVLFDSTTGVPLPLECFDSEEAAEKFLADCEEVFPGLDIRVVSPKVVREFQSQWFKKQLDRG